MEIIFYCWSWAVQFTIKPYEQGVFSFFLSFFQFCDIKSLENFPKKIAEVVEYTLEKKNYYELFCQVKQNLSKGHMNKGFFLSFFLFNFVISKVWKKIAKLVELTLNKQNIMNYFVRNETKKFKKKNCE